MITLDGLDVGKRVGEVVCGWLVVIVGVIVESVVGDGEVEEGNIVMELKKVLLMMM